MKTKLLFIAFVLIVSKAISQAPQKISYQMIIRDNNDQLIASSNVEIKISLIEGSETGNPVYQERHIVTTNINGQASFQIGNGTIISGIFSTIDWQNGTYFVKTETDPTGGTNYAISGISRFSSVPFALFTSNYDPTVVGGYHHYIGEEKDGGIIFYLYTGSDGVEHGLIVSKTESDPVQWQTVASVVSATSYSDGSINTNLMVNSPAKDYVASLGEGWYIPSFDEIRVLFQNRYYMNKAMEIAGGTLFNAGDALSIIHYWSSTESTSNPVNGVVVIPQATDMDAFYSNYKLEYNIVRAIRSF